MVKNSIIAAASTDGLPFDTGTYILFTIVAVLVLAGLSVLMFFRAKKDYGLLNSRVNEKGLIPRDHFRQIVNSVAAQPQRKLKYSIYQVDLRQHENLLKVLGEAQYKTVVGEVVSLLLKLEPWGVKIGEKSQHSLYVLVHVDENTSVESICRLIISSLNKTYTVGMELKINLDVNVAAALIPEAGKTFEELDKCLDIAMVVSKRQGENRFVLYSQQYGNEDTEEYKYYQEIREAIRDKEFILLYQPIVDTNTFEVVSAESLMRWAHKTKGVLPPQQFLSIMEQTGDIYWVGLWCFEQMVSQLLSWRENYDQSFTIGCNLSERQLLNVNLFEEIRKIIRKYHVEPSWIVFEISDLGMYNISSTVKDNIDKLSQMGAKICLDGFGSKFASLTALQDLPINVIKIEKGFWSKIDSSSIVKNTIGVMTEYAKENGILIVALGVEDAYEMDMLRSIGINYMQGYAFSKPKDSKDYIGDVMFTPWAEDLKNARRARAKAKEETEAKPETPPKAEENREEKSEEKPEEKSEEKPETAEQN